jgi:hypothetical protein
MFAQSRVCYACNAILPMPYLSVDLGLFIVSSYIVMSN